MQKKQKDREFSTGMTIITIARQQSILINELTAKLKSLPKAGDIDDTDKIEVPKRTTIEPTVSLTPQLRKTDPTSDINKHLQEDKSTTSSSASKYRKGWIHAKSQVPDRKVTGETSAQPRNAFSANFSKTKPKPVKGPKSAIPKQRHHVTSNKNAQYDERECLANALQFSIEPLIDGILFTDSELPDLLLSGECLTEDECAEIRKLNRKDQIRLLVSRIKDRNLRVLKTFLQYITEQNPSVAAKIHQEFELNKQKGLQAKCCDLCKLKKQVNVKDVADGLWAIKAIPDDLHLKVIHSQSPVGTEELWEEVIRCLNGLGKQEARDAYAKLVENLTIKKPFTHIADGINGMLNRNSGKLIFSCNALTCSAFRKRSFVDRNSTSTSEESEYPESSVDYTPDDSISSLEEEDEDLSKETITITVDGEEYQVEVRGKTNRIREAIERKRRFGIVDEIPNEIPM